MSFLRRISSFDELLCKFEALIARGRYEKAWDLCQQYAYSKAANDFSFTFSPESARVGLLAAKAAAMAGAHKRAYVECSISALILENEVQYPTCPKEGSDKADITKFLSEAQALLSVADDNVNDLERADVISEVEPIRVSFQKRKANVRLHMLAEQKIGMSFIERWFLRRKLKAMHKARSLRD